MAALRGGNGQQGCSNDLCKKKGVAVMEWQLVLALAMGIPLVLLPVAFVAYLTVGGYVAMPGTRKEKAAQCSVDADCGPGFVCKKGTCVPSDG
jgi:Cys-rich repeat protein